MTELLKTLSGSIGWQFLAQFILFLGIVGSGLYLILERAYKQRINFLKETVEEYRATLDEKVERRTAELKKQLQDLETCSEDLNGLLRASIEILIWQFGDIIEGGHLDEYLAKCKELTGQSGRGTDDDRERIAQYFNGVYTLTLRYHENLAKYKMRDIRQSLVDQKLL